MKRKVLAFLLSVLMLLVFCGCGADKGKSLSAFDDQHKTKLSKTFTAAENDNWLLEWDSEHYRILLKNKADGTVWSALPSELLEPQYDEYGYEINNNPQLENPLIVQYINPENMQLEILYGYTGSLKKGAYELEKIEDGFKITYYFDGKQISVPVEYRLQENGINISVDPTKITEGDFKVYNIALSPFFCSASNNTTDGYLFVPSGSGALINPTEWLADVSYTCSYPVYGTEAQLINSNLNGITNTESVKLPVFGAKEEDRAVLAIIEDGAESAFVNCNVGNKKFEYSSVYASFEIRGVADNGSYSDNAITTPISVSYLPITGEKADYIGMAELYREYLINKMGIKKVSKEVASSINLLGATYVDAQFIGIPYKSLYATTTFKDSLNIIKDFSKETKTSPVVSMVGFGLSGVDVGKAAGDLKISNSLGGKKDIENLVSYCENQKIDLYMDYDIMMFSESGAGISKTYDYARNTVGQKALRYKRDLGTDKEEKVAELFVARKELVTLGKKAADSVKKSGINGLSLSSIASGIYSDYSNQKYYARSNFGADYSAIAEYSKKQNNRLLAEGANLYAAINADIITNAPTSSDKNDLFYADIPFYEIVFKGYIPMTCGSVNLAINPARRVLLAAESGLGLGFTFTANYDNNLFTSEQKIYHSTLYSSVREDVNKSAREYAEYFEKIEGAVIAEHSIVSKNVRKTVFDNGITVYVNYGDTSAVTEIGTVAPFSYLYSEE